MTNGGNKSHKARAGQYKSQIGKFAKYEIKNVALRGIFIKVKFSNLWK